MNSPKLDIAVLGLSITSSWGNGHATTYRCLIRGLAERGHRVLFLERDVPWYSNHRDIQNVPYAKVELYRSLDELRDQYTQAIRGADLVIVGSFVPEGAAVGQWVIENASGVTAFYDIDTPVTLGKLERGETEYLTPALIPKYQLYLSFTGGPTLRQLENIYGAQMARPLYCGVDAEEYFPERKELKWALAFMGTYSADRQDALERLLLEPARYAKECRFAVAGSMYPHEISWPENVERIEHVAPHDHRGFYNSQKYTLNLTRIEMIRAGYSPSVRLFEAAACGTPIITDWWPGLDEFFTPGREILVAKSAVEVLSYIHDIPEAQRIQIAERARQRTLSRHTSAHRAEELEAYYLETALMVRTAGR